MYNINITQLFFKLYFNLSKYSALISGNNLQNK